MRKWQSRLRLCLFLLTMKTFYKQNKNSIFWLGCGVLYYVIVRYTDFSLPCPFRYLTGYLCPGCGITTLLLALAQGDFAAARSANIFLLYTLPFLAVSIVARAYYGSARTCYLDKFVYPCYAAALLIFGVYRNM